LLAVYGPSIGPGPFEGMRYLTTLDEGCLAPKLVGCYEEELHEPIAELLQRDYRRVINVGCASGFYVAGFARALPRAHVWGFDLAPDALARARRVAEMNGVADRVTLERRALSPEALGALIGPEPTLVLVDIDGPEIDLLDPGGSARLAEADVVVELHDYVNPAITSTITSRYRPTHDIRVLKEWGRNPTPAHYPRLAVVPFGWARRAAVAERRPARQSWAIMTAARSPTAASAPGHAGRERLIP
jgi:hypothetical protein